MSPRILTIRERLERHILVTETGCWEWQAFIDRNGYGVFGHSSKRVQRAHRAAYEEFVGPIPEGLTIDHLCNNPPCVNPDHLEPVTMAENNRRRGARQTHCKRGHEFTEENTYRWRTMRRCRTCDSLRAKERAAKRREQVAS